jgi:hypothetical protein
MKYDGEIVWGCRGPLRLEVDEADIVDLSIYKGELPDLYWFRELGTAKDSYYGCRLQMTKKPAFLEARWTDSDGLHHEDRIQICPFKRKKMNSKKP